MSSTKNDVHILLVEDSETFAVLVRAMLRRSASRPFRIEPVTTLAEGIERLADAIYDAVLLDLNLPDSRGMDTLVTVLDRPRAAPVIVLTALEDEEMALHAIRLGAQDFLVKGSFDGCDLWRSVCYAIERHRIRSAFEQPLRDNEASGVQEEADSWKTETGGAVRKSG